jgi:hypothetical protein
MECEDLLNSIEISEKTKGTSSNVDMGWVCVPRQKEGRTIIKDNFELNSLVFAIFQTCSFVSRSGLQPNKNSLGNDVLWVSVEEHVCTTLLVYIIVSARLTFYSNNNLCFTHRVDCFPSGLLNFFIWADTRLYLEHSSQNSKYTKYKKPLPVAYTVN